MASYASVHPGLQGRFVLGVFLGCGFVLGDGLRHLRHSLLEFVDLGILFLLAEKSSSRGETWRVGLWR
jgi:hypothetical protein